MRFALAVVALLASSSAFATMPVLSAFPREKTLASCRAWASIQDEDAVYTWSIQESGERPQAVGLDRLTQYCLRGESPEIVGYDTSAGAAESYCVKHSSAAICKKNPIQQASGAPEALKPDTAKGDQPSCVKFSDHAMVFVSGFVVEYKYQDEETSPRRLATAIRLDRPICFEKTADQPINTIEIDKAARSTLGHHVKASLEMIAGDAWYANVKSIAPDISLPP